MTVKNQCDYIQNLKFLKNKKRILIRNLDLIGKIFNIQTRIINYC